MYISKEIKRKFHETLREWYLKNKRDFPWRYCDDPYKVLVSEVLLQKTNASKVVPIYRRFIRKYKTASILQNANFSDVKKILKDLGLLYRAERVISIGKHLSNYHKGKVPSQKEQLLKLRGIGKYASSAVMCFAFNKREPIVDNNVVRLFKRIFGYKSLKKRPREDVTLWKLAESLLPYKNVKDYNYALLDFSALQCTARNPQCTKCPLRIFCKYYKKKINKKHRPIGIDLFTGIGGLSLGFEQAGFDMRYAVECDRYAAETYRNNRKNKNLIVNIKDIHEISPRDILSKIGLKKGEVDIIIGGPPCQGFSISNMKTRNMDNPQNHLIFRFVEFVKEIKPKWFLMENVAGLDTFEFGLIREQLLEMFQKLRYKTECITLNAVNFGVPQNRNRIFFIGNRTGNLMDYIRKLKNTKIKNPVAVYDAISDLPHLKNGNNIDIKPYNGQKKRLSKYQIKMRSRMNGKVSNNLVSRNTELVLERYKHISQGENLLTLAKKMPSLVANYKNVDNCHHWIYLRLPWNKPAVTINNYRKNMLIHPSDNRGISVREAARLQSFPDNYIFYGPLSFQQQQVANAVPPLLAYKLGKFILQESDLWKHCH